MMKQEPVLCFIPVFLPGDIMQLLQEIDINNAIPQYILHILVKITSRQEQKSYSTLNTINTVQTKHETKIFTTAFQF